MDILKIGIVVADSDEYKPLLNFIEKTNYEEYSFLGRMAHKFKIGNAQVVSILCGIGKVNATAAAMHLVDIGCNIILNFGLSGGISGVFKGDVCLCDKFLEHDFELTGIGYKPCEKPSQRYVYNADVLLIEKFKQIFSNVKVGTAVTGDRFICNEKDREYFKNEFSAMSRDMETAAIAYVCDFANIPFLALRRISDDAGADAVDSYREMNTAAEAVLSDYIIDFIKALNV